MGVTKKPLWARLACSTGQGLLSRLAVWNTQASSLPSQSNMTENPSISPEHPARTSPQPRSEFLLRGRIRATKRGEAGGGAAGRAGSSLHGCTCSVGSRSLAAGCRAWEALRCTKVAQRQQFRIQCFCSPEPTRKTPPTLADRLLPTFLKNYHKTEKRSSALPHTESWGFFPWAG